MLWALALATRLPAVWLMPNADGDAYTYAEIIDDMREKISRGHFTFADLFGFWLPLYQFVSACISYACHLPALIAGKLVSALCGAGSAVLVFRLTQQLTTDSRFAWAGFALVLLDPLHLFLSGVSMTDVPNAFLVLGSLSCAVHARWIAAAALGAMAEAVRVDSWLLLGLLPALQFVRERRVDARVPLLLAIPPLLWLAVSFVARGDALAYFVERARYVERYLEFEPLRRGFAFAGQDFHYFVAGAHTLVVPLAAAACGVILATALTRTLRNQSLDAELARCVVIAGYFCAFLLFLIAAYLKRDQPVIWMRYGLIFFLMGVPLAAWLLFELCAALRTRRREMHLLIAAALVLAAVFSFQRGQSVVPAIRDDAAHRRIAETLRNVAGEDPTVRCFADDPAVRVLSRLPRERFVRTEGNEAVVSFTDFLYEHGVRYLVVTRIEHSLPVERVPALGSGAEVPFPFSVIQHERSPGGYGSDVWLYRVASRP